jgi:putative N6-adenine-specific DNA methylase
LEKLEMLAKTFAGLENVLKDELIEIGASDVEIVTRGVKFSGNKEILYKANFCCRTALRILRIIETFKAKNAQDLYDHVFKLDWTTYFDISQSFAVSSTVYSGAFNNSMFVSLKAKDAIVDQFRSKLGKRPSVNIENPEIRINVHVAAEEVTLSLDSSGESLHKRGYRVGQSEASMSEVLAAGILKLAGWKGQSDLYDPMCGSGTIAIEAALIARNIPPGIFRKSFAFENWKDFDSDLFDEVYNADYEIPFENQVYASDIHPGSVRMASENARSAGLKSGIHFDVKDFAQLKPQTDKGLVIMNPPYGERMNDRMVAPVYNMIGTALKNNFTGFNVWIISSSEDGFKNIGLRHEDKIDLYNGALECTLRLYNLYEGSKKASRQYDQKPAYGSRTGGSRDSGDRPRFGSDRPSFGGDRPRFGNDRPRNDSGGDRPRFGGDRSRNESGGDRPRFGNDRPRHDSGGDRPRFGNDRPRNESGGDRPRFGNDRPQFNRDQAPRPNLRPRDNEEQYSSDSKDD